MAAHLPPGGRMVNYDPQTYRSYPGSPQGDARTSTSSPGLPSVSGYASIVNGNYESATHTHEQDDLDIGQLSLGHAGPARPARGGDACPSTSSCRCQSMPASLGRRQADLRGLRQRPGARPGLRRRVQRHRLSLLPRAAAGPARRADRARGSSASRSSPSSATLVLQAPGRAPAPSVRFGTLRADGSTRWGAPCRVAAGCRHASRDRCPAGSAVGLSVRVVAGSPPPARGGGHGGRPPLRARRAPSPSAIVPGPLAAWPGCPRATPCSPCRKPPTPVSATTCRRPARCRSQVHLEHDEVGGGPD